MSAPRRSSTLRSSLRVQATSSPRRCRCSARSSHTTTERFADRPREACTDHAPRTRNRHARTSAADRVRRLPISDGVHVLARSDGGSAARKRRARCSSVRRRRCRHTPRSSWCTRAGSSQVDRGGASSHIVDGRVVFGKTEFAAQSASLEAAGTRRSSRSSPSPRSTTRLAGLQAPRLPRGCLHAHPRRGICGAPRAPARTGSRRCRTRLTRQAQTDCAHEPREPAGLSPTASTPSSHARGRTGRASRS